jgi:hypothetical protein
MRAIINKLSVGYLKEAYYEELANVLGHIETVRRLDRAYDMLTRSADYDIALVTPNSPMTFCVKSPNGSYTVIPAQQSCTCPDSEQLCKHRLAVKLILACLRKQREQRSVAV